MIRAVAARAPDVGALVAAIGMFSAITGRAVASGPLVGGAVVEGISGTWIVWINARSGPVAIPPSARRTSLRGFGVPAELAAGGASEAALRSFSR